MGKSTKGDQDREAPNYAKKRGENLASQDPPSFCLQCLLRNPQVLEQEPELGNGGGKLGVVGRDGGLEVLGYNHHQYRRQVETEKR